MEADKNSKIVPVIIAIFVFLLLVFSSGYAFYAASVNNEAITNITSDLPQLTTFDSTATDCGMNITPAMMTPENAGHNYTQTCTISVTINGSKTAFCTYDIFVEEVNTPNYTRTSGVGSGANTYEFTGSISGSATVSETQMDTLSGTNILTHEVITVAEDDTPVTKTYTITQKWYNINLAQDSHVDRSYFYKFKIANVAC